MDQAGNMPDEGVKKQCSGADCSNEAGTLQCPTCQKQGLDSFFCSQDCFKRNWVCESTMREAQADRGRSADMFAAQSSHKTVHKKPSILSQILPAKLVSEPDPATGHFNPYPSYPYTGPLRPVYPLSAKRDVPSRIQHPDYAKDGIPRSEQVFINRNKISILDKAQQDAMRKVCRLAREVLDIAAREVRPGVTTDYIDEVVHKACMERDVSKI